ncbi:hypothetical protein TNCV_1232581 [Trichonephila clavipes]|nr:hypothetical protein TNCV_1232581 [Trichonephila clavipes]
MDLVILSLGQETLELHPLSELRSFGRFNVSLHGGSSVAPGLESSILRDNNQEIATSIPVDPQDHRVLTSTEMYSRAKELKCRTWVHPWYFQRHHIIQGFQIISDGILAIFDWSPEMQEF